MGAESGVWKVKSGVWRVKSGVWRVKSGAWRVELKALVCLPCKGRTQELQLNVNKPNI